MNRNTVLLRAFTSVLFAGALLGAAAIPARADLQVTSETLLRAFERNDASDSDEQVLPIYEYLRIEAGALREPGLSFHLQAWGRDDLANSDYFAKSTAGEILYGYLQYQRPKRQLDVRLGRMSVFSGVTRDSVDGLYLQTAAIPYLDLTLFGGQPPSYDELHGRSGDDIYGGRLALTGGRGRELGFSFKESHNDGDVAESRSGVDVALNLPAGLWLSGLSSYNNETSAWAEHDYELRIPVQRVTLRPFFRKYDYSGYFDSTGRTIATPFLALAASDEILTSYGADLTVRLGSSWDIGLRGKAVDKQQADTTSGYYAGLLNWRGQGLTSSGIEAGRMEGEADEDRYLLGRFYFYLDGIGRGFVSGEVSGVSYDEKVYDKSGSLFTSLAVGQRFLDDLIDLRLVGDYSSNPYYDEDVRGMLILTCRFSRPSNSSRTEAVR